MKSTNLDITQDISENQIFFTASVNNTEKGSLNSADLDRPTSDGGFPMTLINHSSTINFKVMLWKSENDNEEQILDEFNIDAFKILSLVNKDETVIEEITTDSQNHYTYEINFNKNDVSSNESLKSQIENSKDKFMHEVQPKLLQSMMDLENLVSTFNFNYNALTMLDKHINYRN